MALKPWKAAKASANRTVALITAYLAVLSGMLDGFWERPTTRAAQKHFLGGTTDRGQVGTVIQVGIIGLAIIIIILVYAEVESALPTPSNADLSSAQTNATETFGSAMELAPVIMIILLAGVVIAVVQRFRS